VHLVWTLSPQAREELESIRVQRADNESGPYADQATLRPHHEMFFEDGHVLSGRFYWYRIVLFSRDGSYSIAGPVVANTGARGSGRVALHQPLVPSGDGPILLRYSTADAQTQVRLVVYDVRGRELWASPRKQADPGEHVEVWDRRNNQGVLISRGVYVARLDSGKVMAARKFVLVHR
jgi:hypothetical protein